MCRPHRGVPQRGPSSGAAGCPFRFSTGWRPRGRVHPQHAARSSAKGALWSPGTCLRSPFPMGSKAFAFPGKLFSLHQLWDPVLSTRAPPYTPPLSQRMPPSPPPPTEGRRRDSGMRWVGRRELDCPLDFHSLSEKTPPNYQITGDLGCGSGTGATCSSYPCLPRCSACLGLELR